MCSKDLRTGAEESLGDFADQVTVDDWTADGRFVIVREMNVGGKIHAVPVSSDREPKPLVDILGFDQTSRTSRQLHAGLPLIRTSPAEVKSTSPAFPILRQASDFERRRPATALAARELFYLSPDGRLMAVTIAPSEALEPGVPQTLFQTNLLPSDQLSEYAVSADGRRFLFLETITRDEE